MDYKIPSSCQVKGLNEIYNKIFGNKTNGVFVDVGAFDGTTYSNTYGLAVLGWSGICYEPIPKFFVQCEKSHSEHANVLVDNNCIGNYNGTIEMAVAGAVSTSSTDYLQSEYWRGDYQLAQKIIVNITTLDDSLNFYKMNPNFDLLSLDVEGSETNVLECFDIDYWHPKMAIVEAQELHPAKELTLQAPFINKYFYDAGYDKIYCDEINNIYIRKDDK